MFKRLAVLLVISLTMTACAGGTPPAAQRLKIVSSFPMTGGSNNLSQAMINAIYLRLSEAGNKACNGQYEIVYEPWDDASAKLGKWDPDVEAQNANKAVADTAVVAYIGTYNSGAAQVAIPILNQAQPGPLVMISPANGLPGLTKPNLGEADEPQKYYPTGLRNYARVIASNDVVGQVGARFVKNQLKLQTVYILDDGDLYGRNIADLFERTAKDLGLTVIGRESFDPKAPNYKELMTKIATSHSGQPPDAVYAALNVENNAAQLLKDKVAVMGDNAQVKYIVPDGVFTQSFIDGAGAQTAEGVFVTVAGVPFDKLPEAGQKFVTAYEAKYGKLSEPFALYSYEAISAALKAIEDVCQAGGQPTDRRAVRDAVFAIRNFSGVFGAWSFDENGDTSLTDMTLFVVQAGVFVPQEIIR